VVEHRTLFRPEHLPAMGFEYPGGRPRVVLSKEVRRIGAGMMKEMADLLMESQGLKKDDVRHFVLHSAGRRVIEHAKKLLDLTDDQLAHSREALRAGAPRPGDWGLMIALGPGFAAEGALLRW
jgi:alkylresorcinol/alkylpyrone synthase